MEQLVARIRSIPGNQLSVLPDTVLCALLSDADPFVDRVNRGVILFEQGGASRYWYLLLAGRVDLYYLRKYNEGQTKICESRKRLAVGSLFGELNREEHPCSARVVHSAEFVRIPRESFLQVYRTHAAYLHHILTITENNTPGDVQEDSRIVAGQLNGEGNGFPSAANQNGYDVVVKDGWKDDVPPFPLFYTKNDRQKNLFELAESSTNAKRIRDAACILHLHMDSLCGEAYLQSLSGARMVEALCTLANILFFSRQEPRQNPGTRKLPLVGCANRTVPLSHLQVCAIWQLLLDSRQIISVSNESTFKPNRSSIYRWTSEIPDSHLEPRLHLELTRAFLLLERLALGALFQAILSKPSCERGVDELAFVADEMSCVKALSHLSEWLRRELAPVLKWEEYMHAGYVLEDFHEGDEGHNWFIIVRGSVDVVVAGKGIVCTLTDGDDFGKLALVSSAPRTASIILAEDHCQFLRIDKHQYNRALANVETNTIRLKTAHGSDALVLKRIETAADIPLAMAPSCHHSVMAGLPDKVLEYLLETRIDSWCLLDEGSGEPIAPDSLLEDFIYTHLIFMPVNHLCNCLKQYYRFEFGQAENTDSPLVSLHGSLFGDASSFTSTINKKRVLKFVLAWHATLGIHLFSDAIVNSFVEELYCSLFDEGRLRPEMRDNVSLIGQLRHAQESALELLSRPANLVLDCGAYSAQAIAPILHFDKCNQRVHFPDGTQVVIPAKIDKSAAELAAMAYSGDREASGKWPRRETQVEADKYILVEVKSSGERVVFSPYELSVPTMLSLNGKLYAVSGEEIDSLAAPSEQGEAILALGATSSNSIFDRIGAEQLAKQLRDFHMALFEATPEIEYLIWVVGRDSFERSPSNLDLLLRRFQEVEYWATTEILLAPTPHRRLSLLRQLISCAIYSMENRDMLALFAITLGRPAQSPMGKSNFQQLLMAYSLQRLDPRYRGVLNDFQSFLSTSNDHRAYRLLANKLIAPSIPFIPLVLKDLAFIHESNKTVFGELVNFEKMRMIAAVLRRLQSCKSPSLQSIGSAQLPSFVKNFRVIDSQKTLMELSFALEPPTLPGGLS